MHPVHINNETTADEVKTRFGKLVSLMYGSKERTQITLASAMFLLVLAKMLTSAGGQHMYSCAATTLPF